ncbi:YaeQ family protein [Acinetobacter larvae]|uniref:YaeQ family protein n=1 Tax=Acinetobacter larvae TaxID=1789224 RepID=A0A1B2LWV1_9GAMM|nr:YaeQ family protein [Acinetobacter larvae]AOA57415.1 hypothetical protein BFG52_02970 [Acinetobacter larvae]
MALKATIYKVNLNIAEMDQHQYADYALTVALHPSETLERMMIRILAFARYAAEDLQFTQDLFESNEPALWQKDLTGQCLKWIEVGCPDEDKIKKASARCEQVAIICYGNAVETWYQKNSKLKSLRNVEIWQLASSTVAQLEALVQRSMQLQLNTLDGSCHLLSDDGEVEVHWTQLQ